ncbi:MAG: DUF2075 domain-containing protein [Clostridia bacterium]|jgi:hypothetical protein|nr:DUF2075 domain-containing protein [Clostridia bacterium]
MNRAYYSNSVGKFLVEDKSSILGKLTHNNQFTLEDLQRNTWEEEISILKSELRGFKRGYILFEYTIPRMGSRIDNVLLLDGYIFLLEFKVGEKYYPKQAINQVFDYALDLKYFHKESHNNILVPILISTKAQDEENTFNKSEDGIFDALLCNQSNIKKTIESFLLINEDRDINYSDWIESQYMPTPTIIEAAQALYRGHNVEEISRSDSGAINLGVTSKAINNIIDNSKRYKRKSICFLTGVPGAGKTLAGLNIANERHQFEEEEHAVFLSGNQPLVDVLQEALARDESKKEGVTKSLALKKAKSFIQNIHHFRDEAILSDKAPIEKVAIFDEAQRAWDSSALSNFMVRKKGVLDFLDSEPEFLISFMDRHSDWAVIVCLIGGGQEINRGEAGLLEWFDALRGRFSHWDIYVSSKINDIEYTKENRAEKLLSELDCKVTDELHLSVSLRSFRSEKVSDFVKTLLDVDVNNARHLYLELSQNYPIVLTRDLDKAKKWVQKMARGTERYGLTASSGAKRLRSFGVWVQSKAEAKNWFLNKDDDVRSSFYLEDTATEFDIQGLELDWTIVCWDANFRFVDGQFKYFNFKGTKWQNINNDIDKSYLKNAHRVLLTRARQGFVIFVPFGDDRDKTREPAFYEGTYKYLKSIGIKEI